MRGVYVANPGYLLAAAGIHRAALITEFNNQPVSNIDDFSAQLSQLADGERATVRYTTADEPANSQLKSMRMDRRWFPASSCIRDDTSGLWPCVTLPPGPAPKPIAPASAAMPVVRDPLVAKLAPSLVGVAFDMPFAIAGVSDRNYHGTGLLVDAERGAARRNRPQHGARVAG